MKILILVVTSGMLFLISRTSAFAEELNGGVVWEQHCGSCHNFRAPSERSDYDWSIIVAHMRSVGSLTGRQQRAVEKFLQDNNNPALEIKQNVTATAAKDSKRSAEVGRELVLKNQCLACHIIGQEGGKVGPGLSGVFPRRSEDYVATQILDPKKNNPTSVMPPYKMSNDELQSVILYLKSIK